MECPFCLIVEGRSKAYKVYEDEKNLAFLDIYPVSIGHTLVIPKKHIIWHTDLLPEDAGPFYRAVWTVSKKLKNVLEVEYISILIRGTRVSHLHCHLIPKLKNKDNIFDEIINFHHYIQKQVKLEFSEEDLRTLANKISQG